MSDHKSSYLDKLLLFEKEYISKLPFAKPVQGINGLALFYYLLYKVTGNINFLNQSFECLRHSMGSLSSIKLKRVCCGGPAAHAWSIDFLQEKGFISGNDFFDDVDGQIFIHSLRHMVSENFSTFTGGGGVLHAFRRLPDLNASGYLKQVLDIIESSVNLSQCKIFSRDPAGFKILKRSTHQIICIATILLRFIRAGIFKNRALPLLEVCGEFLYRTVPSGSKEYPLPLFRGYRHIEYFPIGQGYTLFAIASVVGKQSWRVRADEILNQIKWSDNISSMNFNIESGLAGLAYTLRRLHRMTGESVYLNEHKEIIHTIVSSDSIFTMPINDDLCFLRGILGTHAVLLDSMMDDDENWLEFIQIDL